MSNLKPITTFVVVPQTTGNARGLQDCNYYCLTSTFQSNPQPAPSPLTISGSTNQDLICFQQFAYAKLPTSLQTPLVDQTVTLFAAVAATSDYNLGLPNFSMASPTQSVVIPVADGTDRGVLLIFAHMDSTMKKVMALRATADPQIQNGGDGTMVR